MVGSRVKIGVKCKGNGRRCVCVSFFLCFDPVAPCCTAREWSGTVRTMLLFRWPGGPLLCRPCVRNGVGRPRIGREEAGKLSELVGRLTKRSEMVGNGSEMGRKRS